MSIVYTSVGNCILKAGKPAIVGLKRPSGTHFVIVFKYTRLIDGSEIYSIHDLAGTYSSLKEYRG